ncbi:hypothetical protein E4T42_01762 [Aureobasidium subglaciale]|nr:hypothetical protein E4T42_01762 [Aureobasidium subglaciale]
MKFIVTAMALIATIATSATATAYETAIITSTTSLNGCINMANAISPGVEVLSTSFRTITISDIISPAIGGVTPTPTGSMSLTFSPIEKDNSAPTKTEDDVPSPTDTKIDPEDEDEDFTYFEDEEPADPDDEDPADPEDEDSTDIDDEVLSRINVKGIPSALKDLSSIWETATDGVLSIWSSLTEEGASATMSPDTKSISQGIAHSSAATLVEISFLGDTTVFISSAAAMTFASAPSTSASAHKAHRVSAIATTKLSNDATVPSMVGLTCVLSVLAASVFNLV